MESRWNPPETSRWNPDVPLRSRLRDPADAQLLGDGAVLRVAEVQTHATSAESIGVPLKRQGAKGKKLSIYLSIYLSLCIYIYIYAYMDYEWWWMGTDSEWYRSILCQAKGKIMDDGVLWMTTNENWCGWWRRTDFEWLRDMSLIWLVHVIIITRSLNNSLRMGHHRRGWSDASTFLGSWFTKTSSIKP